MAAPNKQPFGSRPGPKAPNVHTPNKGAKPDGGKSKPAAGAGHPGGAGSANGVATHGTPKGVGSNKKNPLR